MTMLPLALKRPARVASLGLVYIMAWSCAPAAPGVGGAPAFSPSPQTPWVPPAPESTRRAAPDPTSALPPTDRILGLGDLVDLGLRNNPSTRLSWANARAAAADYGSAKSAWFPTAEADIDAIRLKTAGTQGRQAVTQTLYSGTASFTWLLFDIGGRSGSIGSARSALIAANWTHNAAIQDVVQQVGQAFYGYSATKALLAAEQVSLAEAEANLAAAEERRRVGVATIADVLQARTAVEQARLAAQQAEGDLAAARGALAVSAGFSPNARFEVDSLADASPIGVLADSVEVLLESAKRARPDLAAAAAQVEQSRADARVVRAARLPSLSATGNVGRSYLSTGSGPRDTYTLQLGLTIPIFSGFRWEYDTRAAEERVRAQEARAALLGQQAALEVFTDYYALRTATERVRTAEALLTSATQSAEAALGRYRAGVGSLLELLTAENTLASARAQRIQARYGWRTSLLELAHGAGLLDLQGGVGLNITSDSSRRNGPPR